MQPGNNFVNQQADYVSSIEKDRYAKIIKKKFD